ncbi:hypothetical protein [Chitinophaga sancti]|uniref:hypothetical protein n=1 Tax=Chitinophaga sancti TaxID=1004 RepID=UPI003F79A3D6
MKLESPVLFLIFNRPFQTMQVFEQIKIQQPARLFIAADGPRPGKPGEAALCHTTRAQVLNAIDWPCEVSTLFRDENLGCGTAVSSAINWFFQQVEEGIILEDDCMPDPTFFTFCTTLLERYRHDERVMHIAGSNYQMGHVRGNASYYFSRFAHIWGWATWRRAWQHYDFSLQRYQHISRKGMNRQFLTDIENIYLNRIDTWDIQWFMSVWFNHGYAITPNTNLITNIGYGKEATHTRATPSWFKKMVYGSIPKIVHPASINIDNAADDYSVTNLFNPPYLSHIVRKIVRGTPFLYNLYKRIS